MIGTAFFVIRVVGLVGPVAWEHILWCALAIYLRQEPHAVAPLVRI